MFSDPPLTLPPVRSDFIPPCHPQAAHVALALTMCEAHVKREQAGKSYGDVTCPDASPHLLARHLMRKADLSQDGEISENEIATMLGQATSEQHTTPESPQRTAYCGVWLTH